LTEPEIKEYLKEYPNDLTEDLQEAVHQMITSQIDEMTEKSNTGDLMHPKQQVVQDIIASTLKNIVNVFPVKGPKLQYNEGKLISHVFSGFSKNKN
jgi:hypothetical protein